MKTRLAVALAFALALAAAPLVRGQGEAYSSLVGMADSAEDDLPREGRIPEGADRPLRREGSGASTRGRVATAAAHEDAPQREAGLVVTPAPRPASAWTKLFILLLPPSSSGVPELRASTAAFAGPRPVRRGPPLYIPRETEEGVRRGMADMMALMSAGADPLPAGRR